MSSRVQLDLVGVGWPVCLLECKSVLRDLGSGQELDVRVHDPEVVAELVTIIERGGHHVVGHRRVGENYTIRILKK